MGALRTKMIEEMRLRNFSPRTEQSYVSAMVGLARFYRRSADQLTQDEIRSYLLHLQERGLSPSSRNVAISGIGIPHEKNSNAFKPSQLFTAPLRTGVSADTKKWLRSLTQPSPSQKIYQPRPQPSPLCRTIPPQADHTPRCSAALQSA